VFRKPNRERATPPAQWTVAELGLFYSNNYREIFAHAKLRIKDSDLAQEITQEAIVKVLLAAPELTSTDHALAYMHRTIENLCIDIFRVRGKRPSLVALDDATSEVENLWNKQPDQIDLLVLAEDAAIVRQALSLLSPAERAALIMWEVENRSSSEIALELGIKESAVRHTVSRARSSLRRILSELVLDNASGLTAIDLLSTAYRKANRAVKKSSKAVMSLTLVFFAIVGFNSLQNDQNLPGLDVTGFVSVPDFYESESVQVSGPSSSAQSSALLTPNGVQKANADQDWSNEISFPGLGKHGSPKGFSVSDSSGSLGVAYFRERSTLTPEAQFEAGQFLKTESGAANVLISQVVKLDDSGFGVSYWPMVSFGYLGRWVPLETSVQDAHLARKSDGTYLVTVRLGIDSAFDSALDFPSSANGRDLDSAPKEIFTRLVLNSRGDQVLSQAVYVVERESGI